MRLYEAMMEDFSIIEPRRVPDGASGSYVTYEEGMSFKAAITLNSTMEAMIAEKQGVTSVYTVTTRRNMLLRHDDIIRRKSDGQVFRVTTNSADNKSPRVGTIDLATATAEKWELINDTR